MPTFTSKISQAAVLRQAVLNTSTSLELFREAVSNSIDADCRRIDIQLLGRGGDIWDVVIEDDGHGMAEEHMCAFFNAGETVKDIPSTGSAKLKDTLSIGEKGLGSKTTFIADEILVESIRRDTGQHRIGKMVRPLDALDAGQMPKFDIDVQGPKAKTSITGTHGSRITLRSVRITSFNGKRCTEPDEIADRVLHYLKSACATGTVKNRFAAKPHIAELILNAGNLPQLTVEVGVRGKPAARRGPTPGAYVVPDVNVSPTGAQEEEGIARNSWRFCDVYDFSRSKTISLQGKNTTVYYDGTVIIAGTDVRSQMLRHELKQGWTQKSQMGLHLCRDFIPLRMDPALSRELLNNEWYYEFKAFLNCQWFALNADRNVVTNLDSDDVSWIMQDFKQHVWPQVERKYLPYVEMRQAEERAIESVQKARAAAILKSNYKAEPNIAPKKAGAGLMFVKEPRKEADVSHLLAMMIQSGRYADECRPLHKFGRYIDDSTDLLCEDVDGKPLLVEVESRLPNLFSHGHPITSYDVVVVWALGGLANGESKLAPWGEGGAQMSVTLLEGPPGHWRLKWGTHSKPVLVLSALI